MPVVAAENKALLDFDLVIGTVFFRDICMWSPGRVMSLFGTTRRGREYRQRTTAAQARNRIRVSIVSYVSAE
jgi:hypothetical protein